MTVYYTWSNKEVTLECEMEYEAEERESFDCPGSPSYAYVLSAKFNGVELSDLLNEETLDEITTAFLADYEGQVGEYEPDYESMLEARKGWRD